MHCHHTPPRVLLCGAAPTHPVCVQYTFEGAAAFNQNIGGWDVSTAKYMPVSRRRPERESSG